MKTSILLLWLVGLLSCTATEAVRQATCKAVENYTTDVAQANRWIQGDWTLTQQITMLANAPKPDLRLSFRGSTVTVIEDGRALAPMTYTIQQKQVIGTQAPVTLLSLTAQTTPPVFQHFYLGANNDITLYLCEQELFLDGGIAFDAPGYIFHRQAK